MNITPEEPSDHTRRYVRQMIRARLGATDEAANAEFRWESVKDYNRTCREGLTVGVDWVAQLVRYIARQCDDTDPLALFDLIDFVRDKGTLPDPDTFEAPDDLTGL